MSKMFLQPVVKKQPTFYRRSTSDSGWIKYKTKISDVTKPVHMQLRWIPSNKGSFTRSMHVSYPPVRVYSSPSSLSTTKTLANKHSIKVTSDADHSNTPTPPPPPAGARGPPPPLPPAGRIPGPPRPPGGGGPPPPKFGSKDTPRTPLKPLHWSKIAKVQQGTIWEELQKQKSEPEIYVSEFETLFSAAVAKPAAKPEVKKKPAPKSLFDMTRANNTMIMLTKFKMPLPDMMAAALAMDETVLNADQVENLIKFCPTKDEMEVLMNYDGDRAKLGKCEQFFMELMKVPRVESKLRVFLFKIQFNAQITDCKKSSNLVHSACSEIRSSSKLNELMRIILVLGNTLNYGTSRGKAYGFKLESLVKLNETRAANSRITLMHYLAKIAAKKYPHLLDIHEELSSLEASSNIQLNALSEEIEAITKGLEMVNQELEASENDGPVSQIFCKTLKTFIGSAKMEAGSMMNLYSEAVKNADELVLYFGEDPARCAFEQVTQTLVNFVKSLRNAQVENLKQAEVDRKKAVRLNIR